MPPPITDPVVMYDAITVYHEWGMWIWETDYWGNPINGTAPPATWQKVAYITPFALMLAALLGLLLLTIVADLRGEF